MSYQLINITHTHTSLHRLNNIHTTKFLESLPLKKIGPVLRLCITIFPSSSVETLLAKQQPTLAAYQHATCFKRDFTRIGINGLISIFATIFILFSVILLRSLKRLQYKWILTWISVWNLPINRFKLLYFTLMLLNDSGIFKLFVNMTNALLQIYIINK